MTRKLYCELGSSSDCFAFQGSRQNCLVGWMHLLSCQLAISAINKEWQQQSGCVPQTARHWRTAHKYYSEALNEFKDWDTHQVPQNSHVQSSLENLHGWEFCHISGHVLPMGIVLIIMSNKNFSYCNLPVESCPLNVHLQLKLLCI